MAGARVPARWHIRDAHRSGNKRALPVQPVHVKAKHLKDEEASPRDRNGYCYPRIEKGPPDGMSASD
jgi:hypothetical protein